MKTVRADTAKGLPAACRRTLRKVSPLTVAPGSTTLSVIPWA
jgi:hypothetical protein